MEFHHRPVHRIRLGHGCKSGYYRGGTQQMSNTEKKICWDCRHCDRNINLGSVGGSTEFYCRKKMWRVGTGMSEMCNGKEWEAR